MLLHCQCYGGMHNCNSACRCVRSPVRYAITDAAHRPARPQLIHYFRHGTDTVVDSSRAQAYTGQSADLTLRQCRPLAGRSHGQYRSKAAVQMPTDSLTSCLLSTVVHKLLVSAGLAECDDCDDWPDCRGTRVHQSTHWHLP